VKSLGCGSGVAGTFCLITRIDITGVNKSASNLFKGIRERSHEIVSEAKIDANGLLQTGDGTLAVPRKKGHNDYAM